MKKETVKKTPTKKKPSQKEYIDNTTHSVEEIDQARSVLKNIVKEVTLQYDRLGNEEITQAGDRPMYTDGKIGNELIPFEIGMKVRESGYFGIVRKKKAKKQ